VTHRFFVPPEAVGDGCVELSAQQAHQVRHVLRLRAGDVVRVFDGVQPVDFLTELVDASHARVIGTRPHAAEPRTRLSAYPALLQRDKFETVLQKLTELGVVEVAPVLTARTRTRELPDEPRLARWRAILREATEQSGRGVVPRLARALPLEAAVQRARADGVALMAYEGERRCSVREALGGAGASVAIFVGPEGGYAQDEVDQAAIAGVRLVTLGPRILRTETASPVLAALVLYELGDLS
jgi:16S rRNA (uracil1498-N3)-methyltransferase